MKYDSILDTIGRTPVVKLANLAPKSVEVYAKIESFNPGGSVKDRLALAVIEDAERSGALKPGQTVIEATSGNTGIGLAMVCARKGYPLVIVMAENFSIERRRLMRFLGAKVVLTPAADKGSGMLAKAVELAETHGWFLTRQFENEANADIHTKTTAQEILADFEGERLDYWVTTFGTGGTLKGVARALKKARPEIKIIAAEADNSRVIGGVGQPAANGPITMSHPSFRPHPIQGTGPDFIPKLTQDVLDAHWIDEIMPVNGADALRLSRELATREGIFAGISAGAAVAAALKVAARAPDGARILCMLPDTGERYLSTVLFDDVPVDMTETCRVPWRRLRRTQPRRSIRKRRASSKARSPMRSNPSSCSRWNGASSAGPCASCSRRMPSPIARSISTRWPTRRTTGAGASATPCARAPACRPSRKSSSAATLSAAPARSSTRRAPATCNSACAMRVSPSTPTR
jgi:cysteine synthase A